MRALRYMLMALILLGSAAVSARAQFPSPYQLAPLMYPPTVSPDYYPPGPGSTYYPPPKPNYPIPIGAPIPGVDNPKDLWDKYLEAAKKARIAAKGNPLEMYDSGSNAFPCEELCNPDDKKVDQEVYLTLGAMLLRRSRMGQSGVAFLEPQSANPGISIYPNAPTAQILGFADIDPNFNWGFRGTLGYRVDDKAVELVGWKIFGTNSFQVDALKDSLYLPFAAFPFPLGVGGGGNNANTWLQVDQVRILDVTDLANVEANFRTGVGSGFEFIIGLRYLNVSERLDILSDQVGLTVTPPDPRFAITYRVQTHSNIIGPQIGFDTEVQVLPWLAFGMFGKALVGANFYSVGVSVFRGDGFTALDNVRNSIMVSGALELGAYFEVSPFNGTLRFRAGYEALYAINIPVASDEVAFNIQANPYGSHRDNDSILFQGPFFEFIFIF